MDKAKDVGDRKDPNEVPTSQELDGAEDRLIEVNRGTNYLRTDIGISLPTGHNNDQQMDYYPFSSEGDTIGEVIHFLIFDTGTHYKLYRRHKGRGSHALVEVKDDRLPCVGLESVMDVILDYGGNEFHVFIRHR